VSSIRASRVSLRRNSAARSLVDKQIPEQAKELGISEQEVIRNVMLKETVDGEFTTIEDVAEATLFCAAFPSNAMTGQSFIVSHGWFMQ
jgi:3-hydroxybutyrate dehydrogenase